MYMTKNFYITGCVVDEFSLIFRLLSILKDHKLFISSEDVFFSFLGLLALRICNCNQSFCFVLVLHKQSDKYTHV